MNFKPDATIRIPTIKGREFFRYWLEFLKPFHNLTNKEMEVAVSFLLNRYELSKKISDPNLLEENAVNEITKRKVREECNITLPHFLVIMGKLKKSKIFVNGRLNPKFIPNILEKSETFLLLFLFDFQ